MNHLTTTAVDLTTIAVDLREANVVTDEKAHPFLFIKGIARITVVRNIANTRQSLHTL